MKLNNIIKKSSVLILILPMCACAIVWGKSYNVALVNSRSVVIEYDPVLANLPGILRAAQNHCNKYQKDAILDSVTTSNLKIKVNTYRCESRTPDKIIDIQN